MKRLILVLLALLLMGCSPESPDAPSLSTQPVQNTTLPAAAALPQPTVIRSDRALTVYNIDIAHCREIYPMGEDMLLISGNGETVLSVLSNQDATIRTQKAIPCAVDPLDGNMQINSDGIAYYDESQNAVVYLNTDLLETQRISLPYPLEGDLLLSPDWATIYYCANDAIFALDLKTATPRMLRSHSVASHTLLALHLDGQILSCVVTYEDGSAETLYISTQTGESYYPGWKLNALYTGENSYFAAFQDGTVNLWITGKPGEDPWMIHTSQDAQVIPLYASDAVVIAEPVDQGTELSYLDIVTGRRTGAITLDPSVEIAHIAGNDGIVWFLSTESESGQLQLYRWSPVWSRVWSPRSYYRTYYTADNPNTDELLRLAYQAEKLGKAYGIHILIGEKPLDYQPSGHTFETEYRIAAYQRDLAALESAIANFPEGFFKDAAFGTQNRRLTISLVRNVLDNSTREQLPGKRLRAPELLRAAPPSRGPW